MSRRSRVLSLLLVLALGAACTDDGAGASGSARDVSLASRDAVDLPRPDGAPISAPLPEDVEVVGLDTVEPVPLADLGAWVDAGVDDDLFTEAEGLVRALRYLAGDTPAEELPGATEVTTPGGTGLVRRAGDLLDADEVDGALADELARLVRVFTPAQEDLDAVSVPRAEARGTAGAPTSLTLAMGAGSSGAGATLAADEIEIDRNCADLAAVGFAEAGGLDEACLVYDEEVVGGHAQRVYYPLAWVDAQDKQQAISAAMEALVASAERYGDFGDHQAVSLVFSLLPSPVEGTGGVIGDFVGDACPITVFRASAANGVDAFKQVVAHEAFHCFQTWNVDGQPYQPHAWWLEGSAEYFSNLVYPRVDEEHVWTAAFDQLSLTKPLWEMAYENAVFFQHLANNIGDDAVLDTLEQLAASAGGSSSAAVLNRIPDMPTIFNELVVSFLSEGIADTGGSRFDVGTPTARRRAITAAEEYDFDARPFVATRWTLDYEQKHRFLQGHDDGGALHGFVEAEQRRDRGAWTLLPEEVRSSCKQDDRNWLAVTTVDQDRTFTIDVTDKEKGVCDPCLLGAWQMQLEDFEHAMRSVMASAPGMPAGGAGATVSVPGGGYYFEFEDGGGLVSQRHALQVRISTPAGGVTYTIDGRGSGQYETDGEVLTATDMVQQATRVRGVMSNGITIDQTPDETTFSFFGNSTTTVGVGSGEARPEDQATPYTCDEDLLTVEAPLATIDFDRIDEIPEPESLQDTDPS